MGAIGWLVDGAAIVNQVPLCRCSYGPYARAMIRICKEESFHQRQGFEILHTLAHGTAGAAGDGPGRGGPLVVPVAGHVRPAGRATPPTPSSRWPGGSSGSPTTSCGSGSSTCACGQAEVLGLRLPDPTCAGTTSAAHYDFTQPDYDELSRVIKGDGPCNRQRMAHRRAPTRRAPGSARPRGLRGEAAGQRDDR